MKKIEVPCVDIEIRLENPEEVVMPLCPFCDNLIMTTDGIVIGTAFGVLSLCHSLCAFEFEADIIEL